MRERWNLAGLLEALRNDCAAVFGRSFEPVRTLSRVLAVLPALLLVACGGGGGGGSGPDGMLPAGRNYFPLEVGNRWIYDEGDMAPPTVVSITGTGSVEGRAGFVTQTVEGHDRSVSQSVYASSPEGLHEHVTSESDPLSQAIGSVQLMRFPLRVGDSFVQVDKRIDSGLDVDGDGRNDAMVVRAVLTVVGLEKVSTPAGDFPESLHQRIAISQTVKRSSDNRTVLLEFTIDEWYAPDVGLVRSTTALRSGGNLQASTQTLVAYRVGSRLSETVPPTVQGVTPVSSPVRDPALEVRAVFSEAVDASSLERGTFSVLTAEGQPVAGSVQVAGDTARFVPAQPWTTGRYTARIGTGARDLVGNPLAAERTWSFEVDLEGIRVVESSPAQGATGVSIRGPITLRFSEPVDPGSVQWNSVSLSLLGQQVWGALQVDGATVTLTPDFQLERGKSYQLQVRTSVRDRQGNPMKKAFVLDFQTEVGVLGEPVELIPDFAADAMAIGDVNGDGINDVVLASSSDPVPLRIRAGRSDGTLAPAQAVAGATTWPCYVTSMAVGDLNGDGRKDLVVGGNGGCGAQIFLQAADGTLGPSTVLDPVNVSRVRIVDLDGDGRQDVVSLRVGGQGVGIWRQDAGGQLALQSVLDVGVAVDLDVGDVNGDGRQDLVMVDGNHTSSRPLAVLPQRADGGFDGPSTHAAAMTGGAYGVAVGDFNGDGRADVAISKGEQVGVYYQGADGRLGAMVPFLGFNQPWSLAVGDMNGDGRADLVVSHYASSVVGVYLQQADGRLAPEEAYPAPPAQLNTGSMALGDANGDGRADLAISGVLLLQRASAATGPGPLPGVFASRLGARALSADGSR